MYSADTLNIDLRELKDGITPFEYALDDAFFEAIEAPDIKHGALRCDLEIRKKETFFEVTYDVEGTVQIPCDRCLEDMDQPISTNGRLVVKFGPEYSEDDDIITVAEDEGILDMAWYIYESIVLNIPIQHVHAPGKCDAAMIKLLEEHTVTRSDGQDEEAAIDPRWSKLAELIEKN